MGTMLYCDRCGKTIDGSESMSRATIDVAASILDPDTGEWILKDGPHDMDLCEGCTLAAYAFLSGKNATVSDAELLVWVNTWLDSARFCNDLTEEERDACDIVLSAVARLQEESE